MVWEPVIGKWNDDNYHLKEPLWRRLLKTASTMDDVDQLLHILSWFCSKNMHGDYYKIVLIGCFLKNAGINIEDSVDEYSLLVISEITKKGISMEDYSIELMKRDNVNEEFIDEFKALFADNK